MPDEIFLPACLMDAYRLLFPDLQWDSIRFYEGMPFPLGLGGRNGLTISKLGATEIYIKEGKYDPCSKKTFTL